MTINGPPPKFHGTRDILTCPKDVTEDDIARIFTRSLQLW